MIHMLAAFFTVSLPEGHSSSYHRCCDEGFLFRLSFCLRYGHLIHCIKHAEHKSYTICSKTEQSELVYTKI